MHVCICLYPGVCVGGGGGLRMGGSKEMCAGICDVAQVTDIRTLPN